MSWTTVLTRAAGYVVGATQWNELVNNLLQLGEDGPRVRVELSGGALSIANNLETAVTWATESYDVTTMHSTSSNTERLNATQDGLYRFQFYGEFAASNAGIRLFLLKYNGTNIQQVPRLPADNVHVHGQNLVWVGRMATSDYLSVSVVQNSGGALNLGTSSWASLEWIGA